MPTEAMNIYFSARDGMSPVLTSIGNKTKALDKETQSLAQSYAALQKANDGLAKKKAALAKELAKVKDEVKDAKKAWTELGDEVSSDAYDKALQKQEKLNSAIRETTSAIRENEKIYKSNMETIRKSAAGGTTLSDIAKGLAVGQVGQMLSGSLGNLGTSFLSSAMGSAGASLMTGSLSGAISGASAGAIAGVPGMILGGLAGAASGLINSGAQIFEAQDDAFNSYWQGAMQTVMDEQTGAITSGSAIAGSREQTLMAFAQRFGSVDAAAAYLDRVKTMAGNTNYGYDEITGYSKLLLNSYSADETFGVLRSLSDATAGLGLASGDVSMMISGLSKMRTTGKATSEYLGYFSERGVDVYQALADATGADRSNIAEMVSKGKIGGVEAAQAILDYIDKEFGGLSDKLAGTYDAMVDNLADAESNLEAMAGEGYNEARKAGIAAQQDWLTGNEGLEDAYKAIGAWQAELENSKEEFIRKAVDAMMGSDAYLQAEEAGDAAEMGKLIMQAKIQGMNEYNASEGAQLALEAEMALAGTIREDTATNQAYWDAGYRKSQEYSKGLAAGLMAQETFADAWTDVVKTGRANSHAYGLTYVPYDGFPALLHQGERVLTASQARSQDAGGGTGSGIHITINGLSVREEADIDRIASALAEKLAVARMAG